MMYLHGNTDIGQRRKVNQDTYATLSPAPNTALCVVCDGMGGAVGGAEASRIARDAFVAALQEKLPAVFSSATEAAEDTEWKGIIPQAMSDAADAANRAVYDAASADPMLQGMGTTLVAAFVGGGEAVILND